MISPIFLGCSFLNENQILPSLFVHSLTMSKDNLVKKLSEFRSDNSGKYISNELKEFFLTSRVIHKLILPYSPESNGIVSALIK
jgi:hypothetical protein